MNYKLIYGILSVLLVTNILILISTVNVSKQSTHKFIDHLKTYSPIPRLYCPWRDTYSKCYHQLKNSNCPFCQKIESTNLKQEFILKHFLHNTVILNIYPYTSGGCMLIIPHEHVKTVNQLSLDTKTELMQIIGICEKICIQDLCVDGVGIAISVGALAGASIPNHVHVHIIPRKIGDVATIEMVGNMRVIGCDLEKLYLKMKSFFDKIELEPCGTIS